MGTFVVGFIIFLIIMAILGGDAGGLISVFALLIVFGSGIWHKWFK